MAIRIILEKYQVNITFFSIEVLTRATGPWLRIRLFCIIGPHLYSSSYFLRRNNLDRLKVTEWVFSDCQLLPILPVFSEKKNAMLGTSCGSRSPVFRVHL